ncbi:MAG: extracellular solute-binding protein [Clostridiales Family XIII bacterium]|jgi:serine/threonine protein kinase|nr:extracellular solute-binding protein [Clostridiales Family XIII bacterium]
MTNSICLNCFKMKGEFEVCPHCGHLEGTPPEQAFHLYPGVVLAGRYVIGTVIGFGGFGAIYKAWDSRLEIIVAIKEFYPSGLVSRIPGEKQVVVFSGEKRESYALALTRFLDEARNMAKFSEHPNIVNIYDFFEENGTAYIIMEYMQGVSLSGHLSQAGGVLGQEEAIGIALPVMEALSAIHATGIVHRDIHPGNIYILNSKQIKILDFGAAKFTTGEEEKTRTIVVTQGYASPEQYRSKSRQGPYTDIYGLGATLYKMLTGKIPDESIDRQVEDLLKRPSELGIEIDENLDKAIMKAMAVNPELRFQRVEQFRDAVTNVGGAVELPEVEYRKRRFRRIAIAAALALVFCVAIAFTLRYIGGQKTLDELAIEADTISMWIPVSEDAETRESQTRKYQHLKASFEREGGPGGGGPANPNHGAISVEIVPIEESEYNKRLSDAIFAGEAPTLFCTDRFEGNVGKMAAPLDTLLRSVNLEDLLFMTGYRALYPSGREIPLGFRLDVLYVNSKAADEAGFSVPDEVTEWGQIYSDPPQVAFGADCIAGALELYSGPLLRSGRLDIGGDAIDMMLQIRDAESALTGPAMDAFRDGGVIMLASDTSALRDVQAGLPGYYSLVPMSNGDGAMAGALVDTWAVSQSASDNQQRAAMLFLQHMLAPESQYTLHLQNEGALPLELSVFGQYIDAYSKELSFLPERIGDIWLAGEYGKTLNRFRFDIVENVLAAGIDEARIRWYLENYPDSNTMEEPVPLVEPGPDPGPEPVEPEPEPEPLPDPAPSAGPAQQPGQGSSSGQGSPPAQVPSQQPEAEEAPSITLNKTSIVLGVGESDKLSASVAPAGGSVAWSSQDSGVASVGATGVVTATGVGSTTIMASYGGVVASCKVSVQ